VGISCGGVWQSRDAGASWTNTSAGMVADFMPPERREDPNIQDVHRIDQCAADPDVLWCQHHCGIYRSGNGGLHWDAIAAPQPSGFGFAVAAHSLDSQRAWFVPADADARRMPVDGQLVVNETRDGGASIHHPPRGPAAAGCVSPDLSPRSGGERGRADAGNGFDHWGAVGERGRGAAVAVPVAGSAAGRGVAAG